jgi:hypothetical protein
MASLYKKNMKYPNRTVSDLNPNSEGRLSELLKRSSRDLFDFDHRTTSAKSEEDYQICFERMRRRDLLPEEIGRKNKSSYYKYRAAYLHIMTSELAKSCAEAEHMLLAGQGPCEEIIEKIEKCLNELDRYLTGPCPWTPPAEGETKKSKRIGINLLPPDWQQNMVDFFICDQLLYNAVKVTRLIGPRPGELAKRIKIEVIDAEVLRLTVCGLKLTRNSGQKTRTIDINIDNELAVELAFEILSRENTEDFYVEFPDPRKFCDIIRAASRKVFPDIAYVVTPYSFRHSTSSDLKRQGLSREEVAKILGHASARSQSGYGAYSQGGRSKLKISVRRVTASRPVKNLDRVRYPGKRPIYDGETNQDFRHAREDDPSPRPENL